MVHCVGNRRSIAGWRQRTNKLSPSPGTPGEEARRGPRAEAGIRNTNFRCARQRITIARIMWGNLPGGIIAVLLIIGAVGGGTYLDRQDRVTQPTEFARNLANLAPLDLPIQLQ